MFYVIFDLEWNNAYDYKREKGINEIIEIGAVKLDEKLNIVDTFKQLIKPKLSKRLSGRFKSLTHITMDEINKSGVPFESAISDFARWSGRDNSVFMSWSNSDLFVLADNFKRFMGTVRIDFITLYADLQKYCQSYITDYGFNQISLTHCAELFDISVDINNLHRALEDCYVSAECFKKVFDRKKFSEYVVKCDDDFFKRLTFKPYLLTDPYADGFDLYNEKLECPYCSLDLRILKEYEVVNKTMRTVAECRNCKKKFWVYVRAKKTYDGVVITKKINPMNKKRARTLDKSIDHI